MTYNVFSGTLNPTQSINHALTCAELWTSNNGVVKLWFSSKSSGVFTIFVIYLLRVAILCYMLTNYYVNIFDIVIKLSLCGISA